MAAVGVAAALSMSTAGTAGATPSAIQPQFTNASRPTVSADGSTVVFQATSSAGAQSVYSLDVNTRTVAELSALPDGRRRGNTIQPQVSDDGCVVAVTTEVAFDLFRDDDGGDRWDVYRFVMPRCGGSPSGWELVSTTPSGTATDSVAAAARVAISGSGTAVAYVTRSVLDRIGLSTMHVVDLTVPVTDPHRTTAVPTPPAPPATTTGSTRGATDPSMSTDGNLIAFSADYDATSATPAWYPLDTNTATVARQVFVWNRSSGSTSLISATGEAPAAAGAQRPIISGNGAYVFLESRERSWIGDADEPCRSTCAAQVFRFDVSAIGTLGDLDQPSTLPAAVPLLVSGRPGPTGDTPSQPGNRTSYLVDVNENGNQVVFATASTNLTDWGLLDGRHGGSLSVNDLRNIVADVGATGIQMSGRETLRTLIPTPPAASTDVIASSVRLTADGNTAIFASRRQTNGSLTENTGSVIGNVVATPTLVMPALDFGSITVDAKSGELFTTVQNLGPGSFAPSEVRSETSAFQISGGTCATAVVVAVGESCSVRVTFSPTENIEYSGQVSVSDGAGRAVTAALAGAGGRPTLRIDPGGLDLGVLAVGQTSAPSKFEVVNVGFEPVTVDGVAFTDSTTQEFKVIVDECTQVRLGPRQSCAVEIAFSPAAAGLRSASVRATTSDGSRASAVVGGWGIFQPTVSVSADAVGPNDEFEIVGSGFPPDETVSIVISGALDAPIQVTTDPTGGFTASATVDAQAAGGPTVVAVKSDSGTFASTGLDVRTLPPSVTLIPEHRVV